MCEIKRYRFPECCNREKWIITKNPAFCEDMAPGATCRPQCCLFIGGVVEVEVVCGECERGEGVGGREVVGDGGSEMDGVGETQLDRGEDGRVGRTGGWGGREGGEEKERVICCRQV
ncbi:hypothetical protein VC83_04610 [Pseudogymnoascus destructans]|uniref:Uncharacterized protein n=1 Tax=Pseudogymnoascus destructans TaxID=655981 RepID=A0A177A8F0_9PEZI|nr:uncharacterized protein VC83_04610 [Pseudogymnoascus destructans]OAF57403.1 hypothetical protein VC83_04610 [Pseudogymnoascus destructans]